MWKSFKHRLNIASNLSLSDWCIMGEAWWALLKFRFALRITSFEQLQNDTNLVMGNQTDSPALPTALHLHQLVRYASRLHLPPMTCLPQALALRSMLKRRGIYGEIKIGAKKTSAGLHAHAWVEVDGRAVGEEEISERFAKFGGAESAER